MLQIPKRDNARRRDHEKLAAFDLNLLRVFDALLISGSVSAAASRLNLSQPATSAALARLRKSFGDPLFVRNGNRMVATSLAQELRPRVAHILQEIGEALSSSAHFTAATTSRRFRIGANDYATLILLAPLAQRFQREAPRATLEIMPLTATPQTGLDTRELDLVIADRWYARDIRDLETLFHETYVSVARANHPRLSRKPSLEEFLSADHALISSYGSIPGVVDHALESMGRTRRIALTVPHYVVAPSVVSQTDLIMTLPSRMVTHGLDARGLRIFEPPITLDGFDVVMASHVRSSTDAAIQWLKQIVRVVANGIGKPTQLESRSPRSAPRRRPAL
jgi:DNA-binding transcriptional LysR family regulator